MSNVWDFKVGDRVKSKVSGRVGTIIAEPGDRGALVQFDDDLGSAADFSRATSMYFMDIDRVEEEPVKDVGKPYSLQRVAEELNMSELELCDLLDDARSVYKHKGHGTNYNDEKIVFEDAQLTLLTGVIKSRAFQQAMAQVDQQAADPTLWEAMGKTAQLRVRYAMHPTWENFHLWRESLNPLIAAAEEYGVDAPTYDHQMPVVLNAISELIRPL